MCGIAGQYCLAQDAKLSQSVLDELCASLQHRGPDDEGFWKNSVVGLCHRRLAIQDIEGGHQPMQDAQGTVLTYNGEIYNHRELRTELEARGHLFRTRSDPEVLLAAYGEWGQEAWKRLNGMFAFALWDAERQSLHLVRDRFGVKPLFFSIHKSNFYFASEPSALLRCPGVGHAIDPKALLSFLLYFQPSDGEQTLLRDIRTVGPGEELAIGKSGVQKRRWWMPETASYGAGAVQDEARVRSRLRYLLQQSVHRQMNADVPVGVCLSGGLDSTILAALFAQAAAEKPPTYTICLEGDEEEADFANVVASDLGTRHKNFIVTADEYFEGMRELIHLRKFPCVVPNEPLIYLLAKRIAPEVKVAMTGEGADELFGGYTRLLSAVEARETAPHTSERAPFTHEMSSSPDEDERQWAFLLSVYRWFSTEELRCLLTPHAAQILESRKADSPPAQFSEKSWQHSALDRAFLFLEYFHLPGLLGRLDGAMMAASVEGRVPYTDNDLVDFVLHLSSTFKYKGSLKSDKFLLRKTFEDLVPAPILRRPKKAFPVPLEGLFQTPAGQAAKKQILECEPLFHYIDRETLGQWMERGRGLGFALQVWKFLSVALFLENNLSVADSRGHRPGERKNSSPRGIRPIEKLNQWHEAPVFPTLFEYEGP